MSVYKGDDIIAGTSVVFVRELAWSAKQQITSVPFTAPKDGMIIGACTTDGTGSDYTDYYLNGTIVGTTHHVLNNYCASANMSIPVKTGDVFNSTDGRWYISYSALWFVPYEYSGASDVEVVTPEYIRNAIAEALSDAETITPAPVTGGAAGTITWDGFDVKKLGKLVNITINAMRHTNDISTPGHIAIVTGLPKPALGRIYLAGLNYGDNGNSACAYIDADGNLGIDSGFSLAASTLYGSVCYMSV